MRRHIQAEGDQFSIADVPRAGEEKQLTRVLWHSAKHTLKSADVDRGPEPGALLVGKAFQAQHVRRREPRLLGPHRREHQDLALRVREHTLEHLDQRFGGPVQILDDHDRSSAGTDLRDQLHPLVLQAHKGCPRLEITGDVETEREAEDLAAGEPLHHGFGRVLLPHAEFLPKHVGERAVGHAAAVGEAAAESKRGPGRQALPERTDEACLADARFSHDGREPRMPLRLSPRNHVLEPLELALATHESRFQAVPAAWSARRAASPWPRPSAPRRARTRRRRGMRCAPQRVHGRAPPPVRGARPR